MESKDIKKILRDLEEGYDLIADRFSATRAFMWQDLEFAKKIVKVGDRILDFGCGNGRLAKFLEGNFSEYVGVDVSQKLIEIAQKNNQQFASQVRFFKIDPLDEKLPLEKNSFEVIFSIAVFHHFPSTEYRLQKAKELYRVLRPGGKLIISVWNLWQRKFWKHHLISFWNKLFGNSKLDWKDFYLPFKTEEKIFERYHHAFSRKEIENLFSKAGFEKISLWKSKRGNIIYVGQKVEGD
jgi:tRNA (uracil-5-)-methyltransferase TRM9